MASASANDINVLNDLIEVTLDSVKGYEDSADQARSETLKSMFTRRAAERRTVVKELREMVRARGGSPEDDTSILSRAHRMFLNLKNTVAGQDDRAVIEEVERGEDHLKDRWERALDNRDLPADLHAALSRFFQSVKAGHDEVSAMKHASR